MAHGRRSQYCPKQKTVLHHMYYIIPAPKRQSQSSFPGAVQIITAEIPCCRCQIHGISWGLATAPLMENLENLASFKKFLLSLHRKSKWASQASRKAAYLGGVFNFIHHLSPAHSSGVRSAPQPPSMYRHPGHKIDNQDTCDNRQSEKNKTFHTNDNLRHNARCICE